MRELIGEIRVRGLVFVAGGQRLEIEEVTFLGTSHIFVEEALQSVGELGIGVLGHVFEGESARDNFTARIVFALAFRFLSGELFDFFFELFFFGEKFLPEFGLFLLEQVETFVSHSSTRSE